MTIYEKQNNTGGNAWFKNTDGMNISCDIALSAFAVKYNTSSVSGDLLNNDIKKLDVIQDVIFIETPTAFFLDKFKMVDGLPVPLNNYNNSQEFGSNCSVDYWFNERDNKIYTFYARLSTNNLFFLDIKEYDIQKNTYLKKSNLSFEIKTDTVDYIQPIKICYNPDTRTYNLATIFKIIDSDELNMISLNIQKSDIYSIKSLNFVTSNRLPEYLVDNEYEKILTSSYDGIIVNY